MSITYTYIQPIELDHGLVFFMKNQYEISID